MASPVFARKMFGRAGNPLIVVLGTLMLVGCTEDPPELPDHAYTTFGDSWRCERGFKRVEDECQSIEVSEKEATSEVPEHAYSTYGDSWKCERGFTRSEDECPVHRGARTRLPHRQFLGRWLEM